MNSKRLLTTVNDPRGQRRSRNGQKQEKTKQMMNFPSRRFVKNEKKGIETGRQHRKDMVSFENLNRHRAGKRKCQNPVSDPPAPSLISFLSNSISFLNAPMYRKLGNRCDTNRLIKQIPLNKKALGQLFYTTDSLTTCFFFQTLCCSTNHFLYPPIVSRLVQTFTIEILTTTLRTEL